MKQTKIWGTTQEIWTGNNVEFHRIDIATNGFCSKHCHDYKFNMFFVEQGELWVDVWETADEVNRTIIKTGESTIIEPKKYHKFIAPIPTVAYEIYWVKLFKEDIIRETWGGVIHG